jgi:DNA-binding XRE family transcriptional regulator
MVGLNTEGVKFYLAIPQDAARLAGMQTTFGQRLRSIREARGVSVRELAASLGVATQRIYDLEKNGSNPTLRTVRELAEALGAELGELVG